MPSEVQPANSLEMSPEQGGWQTTWNARVDRHSDLLAAIVALLGFSWRAWLAHATFFNTDEAWHFSLANQDSLLHSYHASLTLTHPPLLIFLLYYWRALGTSDLILRLPCVIAGTFFCWIYYKWLASILGRTAAWIGLLLVTFLPTMIAVSADLRQYPFLLMFCTASVYFLERAFARSSPGLLLLSSLCLYLAMLTHYSAFLFAASMGIYGLLRILTEKISPRVTFAWIATQGAGAGIAAVLYVTHIAKLGAVYAGAQPLHRFADWYLASFYFHPGQDHLLSFLFRGTFGIFRFIFSWVLIGHIATLLFVAGVVILLRQTPEARSPQGDAPAPRLTAVLLLLPFVINWATVTAGLYPYGRTRQCLFLAIFGIAGVSVSLARIAKQQIVPAIGLALAIIVLSHAFGTLAGRDMLPLADQRHQNMDRALVVIRAQVSPADVIFLDQSTAYQMAHYLCRQQPVSRDFSAPDFQSFHCDGKRIISTFPVDDALQPDTFPNKWREMARVFNLNATNNIWIVQGGWASGFGEILRNRYPEFSALQPLTFGRYLEIFEFNAAQPPSASKLEPRRQ